MKKNIVGIILIGALIVCLMGCGGNYWNENLASTYKEYWDYSLGEYQVTYEKKSDNGDGTGGFSWNDYEEFTFRFKDINGKNREIVLDNMYKNMDLNEKLEYVASAYLNEELINEIKKHDLSKINAITYNDGRIYTLTEYIGVKAVDKSINLFDSKRGIKFKSLSLNNMRDNNIDADFEVEVPLKDSIENTPNLEDILKDTWGFILKEYGNANTKIIFNVREPNEFYLTKYTLNYDGNKLYLEGNK